MSRWLAALLLVCAATFPAACKSSGADQKLPPGAPPPSSTSIDGEQLKKKKAGPSAGDYAMVVPENVVWWPWKTVAGAFKGASDGVQAGFEKDRMPAIGIVFAPLNLVAGFVTGLVEGVAMPPAAIGPSDDFSRTMSLPTRRSTTVWWYPE